MFQSEATGSHPPSRSNHGAAGAAEEGLGTQSIAGPRLHPSLILHAASLERSVAKRAQKSLKKFPHPFRAKPKDTRCRAKPRGEYDFGPSTKSATSARRRWTPPKPT